jgi:hypothetical protein
MVNKREKIDEMELGAELYLKGLKKSKQAQTTKDMIDTPQELMIPLKKPSEDILESIK